MELVAWLVIISSHHFKSHQLKTSKNDLSFITQTLLDRSRFQTPHLSIERTWFHKPTGQLEIQYLSLTLLRGKRIQLNHQALMRWWGMLKVFFEGGALPTFFETKNPCGVFFYVFVGTGNDMQWSLLWKIFQASRIAGFIFVKHVANISFM